MGVVVPLRRVPSPEVTDAELVERALGGEARAKEALYRRHVRMVTGMAHRLLGGNEVDDLVQDAFVAAFERLEDLRNPQAFAKWIGMIVVHTARKRIRRRRLKRRFFLERSPEAILDARVAPDAPPDVATELRALYGLLESLPADVRIALVLRRVEGMTVPEIAESMSLSPATVKRRLQDGEVLLSARLGRLS
ncbi:MAG: sigma-70 family RNA polymerase sigma factor [Sandaracinus sp.]|nr:sigma-70 family RNA polymerase sigma factor [Sandaracinus sp.]MCB9615380.1 sigma-70 family RNA polymerase sigma factor [Sandaracinus sp.]MCB9634950.1 sigma-70 family RNA polymerase sigma factor [Sandaracinus sp.]